VRRHHGKGFDLDPIAAEPADGALKGPAGPKLDAVAEARPTSGLESQVEPQPAKEMLHQKPPAFLRGLDPSPV
jgi:hypothetical protein